MLAEGTSLGPYRTLALLGAGGLGEVHRAHDSRPGRSPAGWRPLMAITFRIDAGEGTVYSIVEGNPSTDEVAEALSRSSDDRKTLNMETILLPVA